MKQSKTIISFSTDEEFSNLIDKVIEKTGSYSSKSEFLRDSARQRLFELMVFENELQIIRKPLEKLRKKVKFYKPLTRKMKDDIVQELIRESNR